MSTSKEIKDMESRLQKQLENEKTDILSIVQRVETGVEDIRKELTHKVSYGHFWAVLMAAMTVLGGIITFAINNNNNQYEFLNRQMLEIQTSTAKNSTEISNAATNIEWIRDVLNQSKIENQ